MKTSNYYGETSIHIVSEQEISVLKPDNLLSKDYSVLHHVPATVFSIYTYISGISFFEFFVSLVFLVSGLRWVKHVETIDETRKAFFSGKTKKVATWRLLSVYSFIHVCIYLTEKDCLAQSARAVEYTDCTSAEWWDPP